MAVRFIIGRSGCGKTHFCVDNICAKLAQNSTSARIIFLTPEQSTFQVEQAVLSDGRIKGYHNLEITSFLRLARKAARNMPVGCLKPLSQTGRFLLMQRVLREVKDDLSIFRGNIHSGFCDQVSQMLSELCRYNKTPSELLSESDRIRETAGLSQKPLADKLHDLAVIQKAWKSNIADKYLDPDEYLDHLENFYKSNNLFSDIEFWIDGFAGFTPQQYKIMRLIMQHADQCNISLNLDHTNPQFKLAADPDSELDIEHMFHPTLETYQRLNGICLDNAIETTPPVLLPIQPTMPRFAASETLQMIEKNVFSQHTPKGHPADIDISMDIISTSNLRDEVEAAARKILELCREYNYRFRDIAIIFRDLDQYHELLAAALEEHKIPYFMDIRREVRHHPMIELVRSVFEMLTENFRIDYIYNYLKTDLSPVTRSEADALENYCITTGMFGSQWLIDSDWTTETREFTKKCTTIEGIIFSVSDIDKLRRKAIAPIAKMRNILNVKGDTLTAETITQLLVELIEDLEVGKTLHQWQQKASRNGDLDTQQIHSQIYNDFFDMLDELVAALEGMKISLHDYTDLLFSAISQMSLRLVPPSIDQVLVGTIERSRQPQIKAAFILGMNDGKFPKYTASTAIITDNQRDLLADDGFELAPSANVKLLHERYLAYIAFTRASEYLWISYPSNGGEDQVLNRSPFIKYLQKAIGSCPVKTLADSRNEPDINRITNHEQLARELAAALSEAKITGELPPVWSALYKKADEFGLMDIVLSGVNAENKATISPEAAQKLIGKEIIESSISKLEEYAKCPFRFFARYLLKLEKRKPFGLEAIDLGKYYHAMLCQMFNDLKADSRNWHMVENEEIHSLVEKAAGEVQSNSEISNLLEKSHRYRFIFSQADHNLKKLAVTLATAARKSNFRQVKAEVTFGMKNSKIKGIELDIADNLKLVLQGIIDRIDIMDGPDKAVAVFDYKTNERSFDWNKFYHGLELQLACYLIAVTDGYNSQDLTPAGMFYMPIINKPPSSGKNGPPPDYILDNSLSNDTTIPPSGAKAHGLANGDMVDDMELGMETGHAKHLGGVYKYKNGSYYGKSSTASVNPQELQTVLQHTKLIIKELVLALTNGKIDITPYRIKNETPCSYCDFFPVCRFDRCFNQYNEICDYSKEEILEKLEN